MISFILLFEMLVKNKQTLMTTVEREAHVSLSTDQVID